MCNQKLFLFSFNKIKNKKIQHKHKMKERWQKQWEKERTGWWIYKIQRKLEKWKLQDGGEKKQSSHLRFRHTGLNGTLFILGKHCNEKCEYWWDNRECYITLYEEEARQLIESLNWFKLKLDLNDLLRNKWGSKSYQAIFNCLRQTHLYDIPIHTPNQLVAVFTNSLFVNSQ